MAVEDVDGQQTALETVQLQRSDAPVFLLVQAWPVPEDEHLPVASIEFLVNSVLPEVPGHIQVGQELGNVGEEPVLRVGVLWAGPVGEHDDERAVLRNAPRVHGLAWESVARGSTKRAPLRTSSRFSCNQVLLKRHMAECSPPSTHSLESSSKSANVSSRCLVLVLSFAVGSNTWFWLVFSIVDLREEEVVRTGGEACFASERATDSARMRLCALTESVCDQKTGKTSRFRDCKVSSWSVTQTSVKREHSRLDLCSRDESNLR